MADIFISYAADDRAWVEKFAQALSDQGFTVWWDRSIPFGQSYQTVIEQALAEAACVFVVWSVHSVQSSWVWAEAEEARSRNILIPVVIDDSQPPLVFRQIQTADLSQWQTDPSAPLDAKLLRDLEGLIGKPPISAQKVQVDTDKAKAEAKTSTRQEAAELLQPVKATGTIEQTTAAKTTNSGPAKRPIFIYLTGLAVLLVLVVAVGFWVSKGQPRMPEIHHFSVHPASISGGQPAVLSWRTENASQIEITGLGALAQAGSKTVRPEITTQYTLVVSSADGLSIQREVELIVSDANSADGQQQAIDELLAAARQAVKASDFSRAEQLINQLQLLAPDSPEFQQARNYFADESVMELLRLARQAIRIRNFEEAGALLDDARQSAPDNDNVQQVLDYYTASKTLYNQQLEAENKLEALKEAEQKAVLEARQKASAVEKYRLQQEAESRHKAYQLEQQQLAEIKARQQQELALQEQEVDEAEGQQAEQEDSLSEQEIRERREQVDKFRKNVLKQIHR